MSRKKQRLELTWIGKDKRPRLEPRILLEDTEKSCHARQRVTDNDIFDNKLIFGDNLLALKALEQDYTGKVKCVFIDPPYNTGSAFEHYEDGLEHSIWLGLMRDRLEILRRLLADDGSLWITIDDHEAHYLKVLCDEIFGRGNFVANAIWQKKHTRSNDAKWLSDNHDHILIYAKDKSSWQRNLLPRGEDDNRGYGNPDHDPRGIWASGPCHVKTPNPKDIYEIVTPSGRKVMPPAGTSWRFSQKRMDELIADNRIYFGKNGNNIPRFKRFKSDVQDGLVPITVWLKEEVGHNQDAKTEVKQFNGQDVFSTPKPERLLERILTIATQKGDLILDSFAGSGTTGAVAHKMGRRWIMVELGEHCHTHIIPRLQKVIDGSDQGGISKAVNWQGGGGFRYYRLAPSMLEKDHWGHWVINKAYNAAMLCEAMCKHMGFIYAPNENYYWMHGQSTETDFIYVTTRSLVHEQLRAISEDVGPHRTLLICCAAFDAPRQAFDNLTLEKIPQVVLAKCEWGKDDYSLDVANLPQQAAVTEPEQDDLFGCGDG